MDYNASKSSTVLGTALINMSTWIKSGVLHEKVEAKTEWVKLAKPEGGWLRSRRTGTVSKVHNAPYESLASAPGTWQEHDVT